MKKKKGIDDGGGIGKSKYARFGGGVGRRRSTATAAAGEEEEKRLKEGKQERWGNGFVYWAFLHL